MAKYGVLYQIDPSIPRSEQRSALCATDVDGGNAVTLGNPDVKDRDCFTATLATTGSKSVYIANNPTFTYVDEDGVILPSRNIDKRAHTNLNGKAFGCFKPFVGQIFGITKENMKTPATVPTVGQYLEPDDGKFVAKASATENTASFKLLEIRKQHFPDGTVGGTNFDIYVVETAYNA